MTNACERRRTSLRSRLIRTSEPLLCQRATDSHGKRVTTCQFKNATSTNKQNNGLRETTTTYRGIIAGADLDDYELLVLGSGRESTHFTNACRSESEEIEKRQAGSIADNQPWTARGSGRMNQSPPRTLAMTPPPHFSGTSEPASGR